MVISRLSAFAHILEAAQTEPDLYAGRSIIEPAVGDIDLEHLGVIHETVMVMVERTEISGHMPEQHGAPLLPHLQGRRDIEISLRVIHDRRIQEKRFLASRLAVFHIYLTSNGFRTVVHR